jgi:predicted DNA-binding protein (UPF0251 family)
MQTSNIRSIGFLIATNNRINLTPVFEGNQSPELVNISRDEFEAIRGNDDLMKQKAIEILTNSPSTNPDTRNAVTLIS